MSLGMVLRFFAGTTDVSVVCFYVNIHPKTADALYSFAPECRYVYTGKDEFDYWECLKNVWGRGRDLIIIEQDIEINSKVIRSFARCRKPWCTFSYVGPPQVRESYGYRLYHSMGCAKYSAKLQAQIDINQFENAQWQILDAKLAYSILTSGHDSHCHGEVIHHQDYFKGVHDIGPMTHQLRQPSKQKATDFFERYASM